MPVDIERLKTVNGCDRRLRELRLRWIALGEHPSGRDALIDIDLVLERRLALLRAARLAARYGRESVTAR